MANANGRPERNATVENPDQDVLIVRDPAEHPGGAVAPDCQPPGQPPGVQSEGQAKNGSTHQSGPTAGKRELFRRASELRPRDHADWPAMFAGEFPTLAEWLGRGSWDGLQPREAGKLSIVFKGGLVIGTVSLPTESQTITLHANSVLSLLQALDNACETGRGPWVDMKYGTGVQRKRDQRKKEVDKLRSTVSDDGLGGGEPR